MYLMNFVIMWIVFGCAAYSVANRNGRRGYIWFGVALLIGPFAILIVAMMPKIIPNDDQASTEKMIK